MKIISILFIAIILLNLTGCEFSAPDDPAASGDPVTVSGQVVESISGDGIFNASVRITDGDTTVNTLTNEDGAFTTKIRIANDKELTLIAYKEGYNTDTVTFFATAGQPVNIPVIQIRQEQGSGGGSSSGSPATINIYSQSSESIGVIESGASESAQLVFQVLDSTGVAIGSDNSVVLNFALTSGPNGGEYIYPSSVRTNALGRATVSLNTGTRAGVVQITSSMNVNGKVINSKPIAMAIYGGFPEVNHFQVACDALNYPYWGIIGKEINFTAFVGDKYSNPVRPGTTVYFNASSGIIAGSDQTEDLGRATVTLLTQPFPTDPVEGPGFFIVTASTVDENQQNITTNTLRLLSGMTQIYDVAPSSVNIPNGGTQSFDFRVSDANGNPLAAGTTIAVSVEEGDVKVGGDIEVKLPDTQSDAYTYFSFIAFDSKPEEDKAQTVIINISVSSPNGDKKYSLSGTSR